MSFKRRVVWALGKEDLLAIGRRFDLEVAARMTVDELRETIAASKRARLAELIQEPMSRDTLKSICAACGLDDTGKEKARLVERILAASEKGSNEYKIDPTAITGSVAREGVAPIGGRLAGLDDLPAKKAIKAGRKAKITERRRAGVPESESVASGSLKGALRQFALGAAGGYTGRDAQVSFATHMLECFGWKGGRPEGADIPRSLAIVDAGKRVEREVALWWPERRTMMEVAPHDANLDFAWRELVRVCLQLDPVPQYVVLTNQRDLQLYDLARDRERPRLAIRMDDLPKYSEAFPFFTNVWVPGATPRIVNVEKVSTEVADLVARLYRSVRAQHPTRERDVIRFTLQCITAMFAEDIGLLPANYFTSLLYDGARDGKVEPRLRQLFEQMNTRDLPAPRVVPYFNGGLFTDAVTLPLGEQQVIALTKAAEANWTYVDPHIFGSVFQGIMNAAERHASGAHYTAHDDIMRVVGPTIVEPWRKRIQAAGALRELTDLRKELFAYRVLDPACGSGNFLYVAFRELYRLDTELLSRMREFPSTAGKLSWNGGISAANFYGIDINPFAVELAKVTLNIAKKIAFEERKAQAFALAGQVEMDIDPSLPLDNLDQNILCGDAIFADWPEVEAIVGNPPFLGDRRIRRELGPDYIRKLQQESGADGVVDIACYFFRRAHDNLREGARAGFVSTSGIRVGKTREASLDYIVANGATITNAVSSRAWPGESAVNVSMVNWVKGPAPGPYDLIVEDVLYSVPRIATHLQLHVDVSEASTLLCNEGGTFMGVIFGNEDFVSTSPGFPAPGSPGVRPMAGGDDLLRGKLPTSPDYCIYLVDDEDAARTTARTAYDHLKTHVYPWMKARVDSKRETNDYTSWLRKWWKPLRPREDFMTEVARRSRVLVCPNVISRPVFAFISSAFVPNPSLYVFVFDDDYTFGMLQSGLHWAWTKARGSKVRSDIKYTTPVWTTFPWPQEPTEAEVAGVANAARNLRRMRDALMEENGWSLRALYQAANVEGRHPLKDAQAALDAAVSAAYGAPDAQDPLAFLLELNKLVAEDEKGGRKVRGPGLPNHLDPKDPRWFSTDCIEPPPVEN